MVHSPLALTYSTSEYYDLQACTLQNDNEEDFYLYRAEGFIDGTPTGWTSDYGYDHCGSDLSEWEADHWDDGPFYDEDWGPKWHLTWNAETTESLVF